MSASVYNVLLASLSLGCAALAKRQYGAMRNVPTTAEFERFQKVFLLVYVLATSPDWLQGPYLYKLYAFYGFSKGEIGFLFVAGFCSSAVFGTLVGGLADRFGRKRTCLAFCALYAAACMTKHSKQFNVLLLGRVLGGVASSILFSVFEAWMLSEHKRNAYPDDWLVKTLSRMTFVSSVAAVLCAMLASVVTGYAGYVAPFDASLVFLALAAVCILRFWKENYGDVNMTPGGNFAVGWVVLASKPRIWLLGFVQTLFEGAMYIFVFSWTPTLEDTAEDEGMPHGTVFASFMVSIMIGTFLYQHQSALATRPTEQILKLNAVAAAACLAVPAVTASHRATLLAFCGFEVCVGVYFPAMGFLRAKYIPEEVRATVVNIFRVPLNLFVVAVLLNFAHVSAATMSLWCAACLLAAAAAYEGLSRLSATGGGLDAAATAAASKDVLLP